ncbi:MAG: hypothetical protein DMG65_11905 [Candidatus Angelobacter sp. Gp1-AA117]|nr:MAG: hypothetical protein DMG65_11905 [Candidatus Angelobacter sp. Gp1-AA117]
MKYVQLQVSVAVPLKFVPFVAGIIAVTVIGLVLAPLQVAVPKVESFRLLMLAVAGSETDHVTLVRLDWLVEQPVGTMPKALKWTELPGGRALWFAVPF